MTIAKTPSLTITWEKLPDDYRLPDNPVDNTTQPVLAAALTDSLHTAERVPDAALISTNYGICATMNGKTVVKAPEWCFVPAIRVARSQVERSYTPRLQGDTPTIVMEFLSGTEGSEYSIKSSYPPGKLFFYEQILAVPNYAIFEPDSGDLDFYRLSHSGKYEFQAPNSDQHYWIPEMQLFLGVWQGTRENRSGSWLRWWDESGTLLLWGSELAEAERQRAEAEQQRAERLAERLRSLGVDPETV